MLQSMGLQRVEHDWVTELNWTDSEQQTFGSPTSLQITQPHSFLCLSSITLLEKAMAPHSSTLTWKIPWAEKPGGLQSMGSRRVGHDWTTSLSLFTFMHWRRKWQPTPVFLPGESQGRGSLVGCRLWGRTVGHDWSDLAAAAAVFHCIYVPHLLYPFICQGTFRLLPCPGYCK